MIDFSNPDFQANPYPYFARLRATQPVHRAVLPDGQPLWLVTRYEDVEAVFTDRRFVKDPRNAMTPEQLASYPQETEVFGVFSHHLLRQDPPNHTRLRALISKAFTPRLVEQLRPRIQEIADGLLDAVQGRAAIDLIDEYAFPLPITVIAEMLGVPTADRDKFRAWSQAVVEADTAEDMEPLRAELLAFAEYLRAMLEVRRGDPRDDLMSALLEAEEAGDKLSEEELYSMVFLLLTAGHETTVNLIGNGVLALLQHPDTLAQVRQDPSLLRATIEELLRYDGPIQTSTTRYASEDIALGGVTIPRGEEVLVVIASADHDERRFAAPERLDITRDNRQHLAFGHGPHYCLGAPLARLEGQIAIGTLLRRFPNLRLTVAPESLTWRPGGLIRGVVHLPVALQ